MLDGQEYSSDRLGLFLIEDHLKALAADSLGRSISGFIERQGIEIDSSASIPPDVYAWYVTGTKRIEYNALHRPNALILAHEGRHAWQFLTLPAHLLHPANPVDTVIAGRFIEADARALHMGVALQTIAHFGASKDYPQALLNVLTAPWEKAIHKDSLAAVDGICASPGRLKQAMRQAFDFWMAYGIMADRYESKIAAVVADGAAAGLSARFAKHASPRRRNRLAHAFTSAAGDPAFPLRLAERLGDLGESIGGNYLLDTKGPPLDSALYTRISTPVVEKAVRDAQKHIKNRWKITL